MNCSNSFNTRIIDTDIAYTGESFTCGDVTVNTGDSLRKAMEVLLTCQQDVVIAISGNVLPTDVEGKKVAFVGPGTYTQSGGPDIVVPSGNMGILSWDGDEWSLSQSVEMPTQNADGEIKEDDDRAVSGDTVFEKDFLNLDKIEYKSESRNTFNKSDLLYGFYINGEELVPSDDRIVSNIISLSGNSTNQITISGMLSPIRWAFHYQFLNSEKEPVEWGFIPSVTDGPLPPQTLSYSDSEIEYFRMTVFSVRDGEENDIDTIQIEFGDTSTDYVPFEGVINKAYSMGFESKYAEKTLKYPEDLDDLTPKDYVDSKVEKSFSSLVFEDDRKFFDLESPDFSNIYSQSVPTESKLGFIREIERKGYINSLEFYIGRNVYTDSVIPFKLGFVSEVSEFTAGSENIVYEGSIQASGIPLEGVEFIKVDLTSDIKVDVGDVLVFLFETPTAMPVFNTGSGGYDVLYRTTANPNLWNYGYRNSSGIRINYVNSSFDEYIKNLTGELDAFKGLNIVTIGDSITYHSGSWSRLLFSKYGDRYLNLAVSGCRFQDRENAEINLDDNISYDSKDNTALNQLLRLAKKLTPQGQQISITNPYRNETFTVPSDKGLGTEEFNDPDLVVVAMGTNDSEYGSEGDIFNILNTPLNDLDRKAGMVEALRFFTEYLISLCPNALIVFVTPIQASWGSSRRYEVTVNKRNRIIENCNYYAVPVIDAFINSGISEKFEIQSSQGKYLSDGLHPDDKGKRLMARYIGNELVKLISKIEL